MTNYTYKGLGSMIIRELNNMSTNADVFQVIESFHSQTKRFTDDDLLIYIDELLSMMKLPSDKGGLNFIAKAPETGGIFIEEIKRIRAGLLSRKQDVIHETSHIQEDKTNNKREAVNKQIHKFVPDYISILHKKSLEELLTINTTNQTINWLGSIESLVSSINEFHDEKLIQFPEGTGTKEFALKHFTVKGKTINTGSLANACSKIGYR